MLEKYADISKDNLCNIGNKLLRLNWASKAGGNCGAYKIFLLNEYNEVSND